MAGRQPGGRTRFGHGDPVPAGRDWHKIDATELWLFHAGSALRLAAGDAGPIRSVRLGGEMLSGEQPQVRIEAGEWQAAEVDRGWTLVSCIVSPDFEFDGFTLAPPGWAPGFSA